VQREASALPDRIPQRDVEHRHGHRNDPTTVVGYRRPPKIVPDALDRGGVLADNARQDRLFQRRRNGVQSRPKREQITHADDAAFGLHVENKEIAGVAEGMALEPGRLRPRYP
jgi:hypothetical protein